jgi:general stress protein 26
VDKALTDQEVTGASWNRAPYGAFGPGSQNPSFMSDPSSIDRVWEIIETVGICMLTTRFEAGLRARPLEARPDRQSNRLLFVTDIHSGKREEVERWPEVCLVFIDTAQRAYLSVTGTAKIENDAALKAAAWRKNDEVWWPGGPTDPDACVLVVEPITAELWDGPSSAAVAAYEFAKARATDTEPNLGENRKLTIELRE